jgi:hypothetical protein
MKLAKAVGFLALGALMVGVVANMEDIRRYIRISVM